MRMVNLVLDGIAAAGCKTHCNGCGKRRIGLGVAQRRSSTTVSEKK